LKFRECLTVFILIGIFYSASDHEGIFAQTNFLDNLYDSEQTENYDSTFGDDLDYSLKTPGYTDKSDGTEINRGNAPSYAETLTHNGTDPSADEPTMKLIPGDEFEMGDHHNYVDPTHPSDETPIHTVLVDSFYMAATEITNIQYLNYLNSALSEGLIEVRDNLVYAVGKNDIYCFTNQYADYSSIGWNSSIFSVNDFRGDHPIIGVMWFGAVAYANWLSRQNGYDECYKLSTWDCDFTKNGYRLPTEAEWEYVGRGGQHDPYYIFPWGDDADNTKANWPNSGDPYEIGSYPWTTPVGFYNGDLHQKAMFNWPGNQENYQTSDGSNPYGLYDMSGNVWEFVNDWYGQDYYSISPYSNPTGPDSGFIMPDGKPYRGMRSGNWYNGENGHARVANRNPSYYRGPNDPNHAWYHIGFRVARKYDGITTSVGSNQNILREFELYQNYPNPFNPITTIVYQLSKVNHVTLNIYSILGQKVATLVSDEQAAGTYKVQWNASGFGSGFYFYQLKAGNFQDVKKMLLIQ